MRPFGYEPDRVTIRESEAEVIREMAARVLTGETLSSICRDMKDRGVKTSGGGHFTPSRVRELLLAARISGRREYIPKSSWKNGRRPLVGNIVATAVWPAIISPEVSDQLRHVLTRMERGGYRGSGRTYLLSGLLRCGRCGNSMVGRHRAGVPRYTCARMPGGPGCNRICTIGQRTDQHIRDMVLTALASPELAARMQKQEHPAADISARLRQAEERLAELAADYAAGDLSRAEWRAARDVLNTQLEKDRDALARASRSHALLGFAGSVEQLLQQWETLSVGQQRTLVAACVERIVVHPASKKWDPDRFEVVWRI